MIAIIEQGFLRRNWGKLAVGGGALAFAASRGEEMPIGSVGKAVGKMGAAAQDGRGAALRKMADQMKAAGKSSAKFVGGVMQDPNAALQKGATAAGTATRKVVDTAQQTGQSFKRGYEGKPNIPNVSNTPVEPSRDLVKPGSGRYWNKSFRGTGGPRPNVPIAYQSGTAMA